MHPILVPNNWTSGIEITNLNNEEPLHGNNYTLICSVTAIEGMNLDVEVHWVHSGSEVQTGGRLRVGSLVKNGTVTTRKLKFSSLLHDDGGGYTCIAKVDVSWMPIHPPQKKEMINVVVTSKASYKLTQNFDV